MSDSVYRKTPLPVKLNLSDRNTKEQLGTGPEEKANGRGALEGVGLAAASPAGTSQKNCNDVMRQDLRDWMKSNGMEGPPPSGEAEQRAMWTWMRDFHKEYNDDWFARNMPRLHEKFRPIFMDEMKKMRAETAAAKQEATPKAAASPATPAPPQDLLDFGAPAANPASASPAGGAAASSSPAPQANDAGALLDFDFGSSSPPPAAAASPSAAPAAAPQSAAAQLGDLLDAGAPPSAAPAAAPPYAAAQFGDLLDAGAPPSAAPAAAPQSAPAKNEDLLDLMF